MKSNIKLSFKGQYKLFICALVSFFIIILLYSRVDFNQLKSTINEADYNYLILGLTTFFIGLSSSFRYSFFLKIRNITFPNIQTSFKSYFIVSCFNLFCLQKLEI